MAENIDGASAWCNYPEILLQAQRDYEAQPSLTVSVHHESENGPGTIVHVSRRIDPEVRSNMIKDPAPLIAEVEAHLSRTPCMFTKTGQCAIALFLAEKAARRPL